MALRLLTAGESHGQALIAILEGVPAGLELSAEDIDADLRRRQGGYGRGGRQAIERDRIRILAGVRFGRTLGSPIGLYLENRDWPNWAEAMAVEGPEPADPAVARRLTRPRPGHADLAGFLKYGHADLRNVLERASARETAMRVAAGAVARRLLAACGMRVGSRVVAIGEVWLPGAEPWGDRGGTGGGRELDGAVPDYDAWARAAEASPVRCPDPETSRRMVAAIDAARKDGDTLGGVFEVWVTGVVPGLGSYAQWDRRLDGRLAQALMSVNAVKGVEIGLGFAGATRRGSRAHDEIHPAPGGVGRPTNRAGGLEAGVTNGMPLVVRCALKPIATLVKPLSSVDLATGEPAPAGFERSDACAVPAAAVIGEAAVALVVADALLEKFGGDSMDELLANVEAFRARLRARFGP